VRPPAGTLVDEQEIGVKGENRVVFGSDDLILEWGA